MTPAPRPLPLACVLLAGAAVVALAARAAPAAAEEEAPKKSPPILLHVEGSPVVVTLEIPGYAQNDRELAKLRESAGAKALTAGSSSQGIILTVVAEKEEGGHLTSEQWMRKLAKDADSQETFQVGEFSCINATDEAQSTRKADFRAFPVAGGFCFDIHATQIGDPEDENFLSRRRFRELIETFRVGVFRRGTFADYPPEVLEPMHAALVKHPDWRAAVEAAVAAKPTEWAPAFVAWELLRAFGAPEADVAAANEKVATLLATAAPTDTSARFAWTSAEESLGSALHAGGKFKAAAVRLKKALEVAPTPATKGPAAYALARSLAKAGSAKEALEALKTAIEHEPKLRESAPKEADFTVLKARPEFKALVAPPPAPPK